MPLYGFVVALSLYIHMFECNWVADVLQVVVTGAAGRTGALVVQKLLQQPSKFTEVRAAVRGKQVSAHIAWLWQ